MFLNYLRYINVLCHGENILIQNRTVTCSECQATLLDVPEHLAGLPSHTSCLLAKYYAEATGDVHIPCKIALLDVPGIRPTEVMVPYHQLLSAIQLLGVVNGEFVDYACELFQRAGTLKSKIIEHFIANYITMVRDLQYEREDIDSLIKSLLEQMKNVFDTEHYNVIEYYLNVLCPYVKGLHPSFQKLERRLDAESAADVFLELSRDAVTIRQEFGRFCIPFDIMFVMVYCYLCSADLEVVANFVFDLIARICRGHFDEPTGVHTVCENALAKEISFKSNTELHYIVKSFRDGTVMDLISSDFVEKFGRLQKLVMTEFNRQFQAPNATLQSYAFSQSFPFILFPDSTHYYAFMCTMAYLLRKVNASHGRFEKGVVGNAKHIFRFIVTYAQKVAEFQGGLAVEFWTLDMFKLFLSSDPDLVTKFKEFLELLT